ncbi:MAG: GTP-binding protein [Ectothiorhodospiraceae bacterium]|nr:GTP-binding protein [Ectothiorhodospiraceae bacterium]
MTDNGIPTTLICGFLGAGKTTHINRLINAGRLRNALFLVNDFGSINIDAELIQSSGEQVLRLNNGCACCGVAGNLSAQLSEILRWQEPPERLVFEASGIARPKPLRQLFAAARGYRLTTAETLVDASALQRHLADTAVSDIVRAQVTDVDCLRVNRLNWLDGAAQQEDVLEVLRELNPEARLIREADRSGPPAKPATAAGAPTGPVDSATVAFPEPVDVAAVAALLETAGPDLLRAKGMIGSREPGNPRYLVQTAGGRTRAIPTGPGSIRALVLIGHRNPAFENLLLALRQLAGNQ